MDIKKFFNNWIVRNLLLAIGIIALCLVIAFTGLKLVTHHGKELIVPDFTDMSVEEASSLALSANMHVEVADSVFVRRMTKGAVYRQNPVAGSKVKKGRRILLVINAVNAKKVSMPNLVGYSMRQAKAELVSRGLNLGRLIYRNDMATNNVLEQLYHKDKIEPGTQIESGSSIDLVVGLSSNEYQTYVPDVRGMKNLSAVDALHGNSLNLRRLVFDKSVEDPADSMRAVVWKQSPSMSEFPCQMGSDVTLYLTVDEELIEKIRKEVEASKIEKEEIR